MRDWFGRDYDDGKAQFWVIRCDELVEPGGKRGPDAENKGE